jgi:UDP-N-acetylmuramoyl-tripeptide--D-alanyl-D-alanine ligase
VLGEMAELGPDAERFHREIGAHAAERGVGLLVAVGSRAGAYVDGFGDAAPTLTAAHAEEGAATVAQALEPGDVVLVKGSRSAGLERVGQELGKGAEAQAQRAQAEAER